MFKIHVLPPLAVLVMAGTADIKHTCRPFQQVFAHSTGLSARTIHVVGHQESGSFFSMSFSCSRLVRVKVLPLGVTPSRSSVSWLNHRRIKLSPVPKDILGVTLVLHQAGCYLFELRRNECRLLVIRHHLRAAAILPVALVSGIIEPLGMPILRVSPC